MTTASRSRPGAASSTSTSNSWLPSHSRRAQVRLPYQGHRSCVCGAWRAPTRVPLAGISGIRGVRPLHTDVHDAASRKTQVKPERLTAAHAANPHPPIPALAVVARTVAHRIVSVVVSLTRVGCSCRIPPACLRERRASAQALVIQQHVMSPSGRSPNAKPPSPSESTTSPVSTTVNLTPARRSLSRRHRGSPLKRGEFGGRHDVGCTTASSARAQDKSKETRQDRCGHAHGIHLEDQERSSLLRQDLLRLIRGNGPRGSRRGPKTTPRCPARRIAGYTTDTWRVVGRAA